MPVTVPVPNVAYTVPGQQFQTQGLPQGSNIVLLQASGSGTPATLQAAGTSIGNENSIRLYVSSYMSCHLIQVSRKRVLGKSFVRFSEKNLEIIFKVYTELQLGTLSWVFHTLRFTG